MRDQNPFWPYRNVAQWELACRMVIPQIQSNSMINALAVEQNCRFLRPGTGFSSVAEFHHLLDMHSDYDGAWRPAHINSGPNHPRWMPPSVSFLFKDSLAVLRDLISDTRMAKHMTWKPRKLFTGDGERVYGDLWSGDWWWRT